MGKKRSKNILTVADAKKVTGIHYTLNHTGKMKGMQSLSTSCFENVNCNNRQNDDRLICSHCYANTQLKMYPALKNCLKTNTEILTTRILTDAEIPFINAAYFRFESFGDLNNDIQLMNYFNICKRNPHVNFALWTKNFWIVQELINSGIKKPKNLQLVYSDPFINGSAIDLDSIDEFDKIFTVYDKEYLKDHDVDINCGDKCCLECRVCYTKNKTVYINERMK